MMESRNVEMDKIEKLYRDLGITEDDIRKDSTNENRSIVFDDEDIFARRWDSSFFANARY